MKPNELRALVHAGMAASVFIAVSTIASEISAPFKALLVSVFGHHWIAKSVLSLVVFGLVYFIQVHRVSAAKPDMFKLASRMALVTILAGMAIFGFFIWDVLKG